METLRALSPLDGRYRGKIGELADIFSELGLMRQRLMVEGEYLIALKDELKRLSPQTYIGLATMLAKYPISAYWAD